MIIRLESVELRAVLLLKTRDKEPKIRATAFDMLGELVKNARPAFSWKDLSIICLQGLSDSELEIKEVTEALCKQVPSLF